jgi:hypothetical protein
LGGKVINIQNLIAPYGSFFAIWGRPHRLFNIAQAYGGAKSIFFAIWGFDKMLEDLLDY